MLVQRCSTKSFFTTKSGHVPLRRQYATIPSSSTVITYAKHGTPLQVLEIKQEPIRPASDTEIIVRMQAAPINPADLNMIEGTYPILPKLPAVGGNEGVGKVVAVGKGVKDFKEGDSVIPVRPGLGTWRTFGTFDHKDFMRIPPDVETEYAATISVNPSTAYRLLEDFVKLNKDDVIIQNGANSTVGLSVIQLARERKIKTINIVRVRPNFTGIVERLKALGGYIVVADDYLTTPEYKRLVSDLPKPKLALNCVGGQTATEMARLLDNGGTMVSYGGMSRKPVTVPTSSLIFKDIQLKGFWMSKWYDQHTLEERARMYEDMFNMIRKEKLKLWMEDWDFGRFSEALARVYEPHRERKVVLTMEKIHFEE